MLDLCLSVRKERESRGNKKHFVQEKGIEKEVEKRREEHCSDISPQKSR